MNKRIRKKQNWRKGRRIISADIEDIRKLDPHIPLHKVYFRLGKKLIKAEIALTIIGDFTKSFIKYMESPEGKQKIKEACNKFCEDMKQATEHITEFAKGVAENLDRYLQFVMAQQQGMTSIISDDKNHEITIITPLKEEAK